MKRLTVTWLGITAAAILIVPAIAQKGAADSMFAAARQKENLEGDLNGAIRQYQAIVGKYARTDRSAAAIALVRMAEAYRKLGNTQSKKLYEQVLKEYADQKDAVAIAKAGLGKQGSTGDLVFRQVWRLPAQDIPYGPVSKDGRFLPYVGWGRYGNLFLHDLDANSDRQLTNTGTDGMPGKIEEHAEDAVMSPDSTLIAYSWYRDDHKRYELRTLDVREPGIPAPKLLLGDPDVIWIGPNDWSADGKWIAVRIRRKNMMFEVGLVSVADGSLRVLKSLGAERAPSVFFSPDSRYLCFDLPKSTAVAERDVFVLSIDGTSEIRAVAHRSQDIMMGWSQDGKRLLFKSDRTGSMDLWSVPFKEGKPSGEPVIAYRDVGQAMPIGVTRPGRSYLLIDPVNRVYSRLQTATIDFNTGQIVAAPSEVSADYNESNRWPVWSPDGKTLAYLSMRRGEDGWRETLVLRSVESDMQVRQLGIGVKSVFSMTWGPDGRNLYLQGRDLSGRWGTFQIDPRTGTQATLRLHEPEDGYPSWSPDGDTVYLTRPLAGRKEWVLVKRNIASGEEKELLRRPFLANNSISPDGRYLAASTTDPATGSRMKLLIPTAGGEPRELMRIDAGVKPEHLTMHGRGVRLLGSTFSPDGKSLFTVKFDNEAKQPNELWRIPLDGGAAVKVDLNLGDRLGRFIIHPDGRRIVWEVTERTPPGYQEIWTLENFHP